MGKIESVPPMQEKDADNKVGTRERAVCPTPPVSAPPQYEEEKKTQSRATINVDPHLYEARAVSLSQVRKDGKDDMLRCDPQLLPVPAPAARLVHLHRDATTPSKYDEHKQDHMDAVLHRDVLLRPSALMASRSTPHSAPRLDVRSAATTALHLRPPPTNERSARAAHTSTAHPPRRPDNPANVTHIQILPQRVCRLAKHEPEHHRERW
ncbi:hypothetical protein B0H16DRAFT_1903460 [Mycena metata]|uniref:Uncharacterized protein n=1 Tax=Mycena metata TaxID=1033252 RepID=A0AAD7DSK2_9AGAR|nr:hypothetical protein B0H16DRAFT_1903460 [Mycena metata]